MAGLTRSRVERAFLSFVVTVPMVFGTVLFAPLQVQAALGVNSFEIGADEPSGSSSAGIVNDNGGGDWASLSPVSGSLDPGEVKVINDANFTGSAMVMNPETAADDFCNNDGDNIVKNGTKIDDFPFQVVSGSPSPGKNDICQVYVSYAFAGGDTILYLGVIRREINGTTAVALELNKVNHANRALDDLLVTFEFDGTGPVSDVEVRSWDGSEWDLVTVPTSDWDGGSWEHFGEIAVNLSTTSLLPPPTSVDDCDSFSSVLPYGFAGESANSNVGDWGGETAIEIPRCGRIEITKIASPEPGPSFEFDWLLSDNAAVLDPTSGTLTHGETTGFDVVAGVTLTLAETAADSPYVLDRIECSDGQGSVDPTAITVSLGETVSCTIYNVASSVQVVKGGAGDTEAVFEFSATAQSDFELSLGDSSGVFVYAPGSSVTVTETLPGGLPGWELTGISCVDSGEDDAPNLSVDLAAGSATFDTVAGEQITCTFENSQDAKITVVKEVDNDNGGSASPGDFQLYLDGSPVASGAASYVEPGTYTVTEDVIEGYEQSSIICRDDDTGANVGHPVTVAEGQEVTCTVTNDDEAPQLTVVKQVVNDDGGTATAGDFGLYVNGVQVTSGVPNELESNQVYTITEDPVEGYANTGLSCLDDEISQTVPHPVTLAEGQSVTCTVTNNDIAGSITVLKVVVPADAADPDDFDLTITPQGGPAIPALSGETVMLDGNATYAVGETLPDGFVQVELSCEDSAGPVAHPVELALGQDVTCTVTNAEAPTVTVVKATEPESADLFGFTLDPGDTRQIAGNGGTHTWAGLVPGTYRLTEDTPVDWLLESVTCDLESSPLGTGVEFSLDWGDHITCVFANGELGSITVVKRTDVDTDETFGISISGSVDETVQLGDDDSETWSGLVPGVYEVEEVVAGFQWDVSLSCVGGDTIVGPEVIGTSGKSRSAQIDLGFGDHVTCTFLNEAADADLAVTKSDDVDPVVLTDENPVAKVTYTITVTNLGPADAVDVVVTDTLPPTMTFMAASSAAGSCNHAGGVVTCSLGDLPAGDSVEVTVAVATQGFGQVTDFSPINVVEVGSTTPDPDIGNNRDTEPTDITEVLGVEELPFTGIYGDFWFFVAITTITAGVALLLGARRGRDPDQPAYPG